MCGLLGVVRWDDRPLSLSDSQLCRMRDAMFNRGPDEAGLLRLSEQAMLAHRRLSIRDVQHGQQPWTSEDGRWSLVYNGELYNTTELESLTAGHFSTPPKTRCDTELLMRMLQVYGKEAPRHLRGMFAFAAYDRQTQRLLLVRDRFGIKPLYYAWCGQEFVCASSLRAIRLHPAAPATLNRRVLQHYLLTLRTTLQPETFWEGIESLAPGSLLVQDATGIRVERYWDYPENAELWSEESLLENLQTRLSEAVQCRLVSDVPVGMLLSGGVDSSLLGSFVHEHLGSHFVAECGIGQSAHSAEELAAAQTAADFLGCRFRAVETTAEQYRESWRELVRETGQPLTTPSDVIIRHLARSLKQQVGVVLGGEGADELFGGYTAIHGLGWEFDRHAKHSEKGQSTLVDLYFSRASLIPFAALEILWRKTAGESCLPDILQHYSQRLAAVSDSSAPGLMGITRLLHEVNLEALLMRLDQATMSASLEARVPYTDHRLVEQFWNVPTDLRLQLREGANLNLQYCSAAELERAGWLESKHLLRQLARRRLPAALAERKKASFPTPVPFWLSSNWKDWTCRTLLESPLLAELLHRQPLQELAHSPEQAGMWLWPLLNLAIWEQEMAI